MLKDVVVKCIQVVGTLPVHGMMQGTGQAIDTNNKIQKVLVENFRYGVNSVEDRVPVFGRFPLISLTSDLHFLGNSFRRYW